MSTKKEHLLKKHILLSCGMLGEAVVIEIHVASFTMEYTIPILVIGTKLDQAAEVRNYPQRRTSTIAEECGADEIFLDCHQVKSLAAGSSSAVKLSRFFDRVIEIRYPSNQISPFGVDKRRSYPLSPKFYHND
uniref:Uncharacterized protein n=1 Tax=Clastoptera arizonana TaxID=38151 RepID=A0A1B6E5G3_9HEMI